MHDLETRLFFFFFLFCHEPVSAISLLIAQVHKEYGYLPIIMMAR